MGILKTLHKKKKKKNQIRGGMELCAHDIMRVAGQDGDT
jgi:hypothetical protein